MKLGFNILGLIFLPFVLSIGFTFSRMAAGFAWWQTPFLPFALGFLVYIAVHAIFYKPLFMHVMGHELTHAFWAFLFGGDIKSLHVTHKGGKVILNRSNFLIALAPYFFPLYTILLLAVYWVARDNVTPFVVFLLGVSMGFHVVLTLYSLCISQSDLQVAGLIFSLVFIFFANLLFAAVLLWTIAPQYFSLKDFCVFSANDILREGKACLSAFK